MPRRRLSMMLMLDVLRREFAAMPPLLPLPLFATT